MLHPIDDDKAFSFRHVKSRRDFFYNFICFVYLCEEAHGK